MRCRSKKPVFEFNIEDLMSQVEKVPVLEHELFDSKITSNEFRLLLLLRYRTIGGEKRLRSHAVLAEDLKFHEKTISKWMSHLENRGYVPCSEMGLTFVKEDTTAEDYNPNGRSVYFISGEGLIKIGVANSPEKRFGDLTNSSPVPLVMLGFISGGENKERALHKRFAQHRSHGEWFREAPEILDYIAEVTR